MQIDVTLNIHYTAPKSVWDKINRAYKQLPYWDGFDNDGPHWIDKGIDITASSRHDGLHILGEMPEEKWDEWYELLKQKLSAAVGYPVGEVVDGYEFHYWKKAVNPELDITMIKGGTDNCYIVSDRKEAILVDTGSGKYLKQVINACSQYDMKLIVLTHPHFDHAENAEAISRRFKIPVAYHREDDAIFDVYDSQPLQSYGAVGAVVLKLSLKQLRTTRVIRPANHFYVKNGDTFDDYGFPSVKVVELPGHTRGSIGLLVGDNSLIVGDALDNWIKPGMGHLYYDLETQKKTYEKIQSMGIKNIYYGHGKPTKAKE